MNQLDRRQNLAAGLNEMMGGGEKTGHLLSQAPKSDKMRFHFSVPDKSHKKPVLL